MLKVLEHLKNTGIVAWHNVNLLQREREYIIIFIFT